MDNDKDISKNCSSNDHDECDGSLGSRDSSVGDQIATFEWPECECGCHDPNHPLNRAD